MPTPPTEWKQLEPPGMGTQPFNDPASDDPLYDKSRQIHGRGFGDSPTVWSNHKES